MTYILYDSPLNPFSTPHDIKAWIKHLEDEPASPERDRALERAKDNLQLAETFKHSQEQQGRP